MNVQLVALALVAALVVPGSAMATPQDAVPKALAYLRSQQGPDGRIGPADATAWSAVAFARAGIAPATVRVGGASLLDAVVADTHPVDPGAVGTSLLALERQMLALAASGADPRTAAGFDAVQAVRDQSDGTQLGDPSLLNDDIFGVQALLAAGVPASDPLIQQERAFIARNQLPSGAWSYASLAPTDPANTLFGVAFADVDVTSQGIVAMVASGSPPTDPGILRALVWIKANQQLDGGCNWSPVGFVLDLASGGVDQVGRSNTDSTSWVVMGLRRAGQDPQGTLWTFPVDANPVTFILGMQQADGHFAWMDGYESFSPLDTTAYAIVALEGHDFVA